MSKSPVHSTGAAVRCAVALSFVATASTATFADCEGQWKSLPWPAEVLAGNFFLEPLALHVSPWNSSQLIAGSCIVGPATDWSFVSPMVFDGESWSLLAPEMPLGGVVRTFATYDDGFGEGEALYMGGVFSHAGDVVVNHVARWDGAMFSPLGSGVTGGIPTEVHGMAAFNGSLYVAGRFNSAGGVSANNIVRWDGSEWSALDGGAISPSSSQPIYALAVYDDGSGEALYVGGYFYSGDGPAFAGLARWDGNEWSAVAELTPASGSVPAIYAMTVFDDEAGNGNSLFVGGAFASIGGAAAKNLARWDGSEFTSIGDAAGAYPLIYTLDVADDGTGDALYAGGSFASIGGVSAANIARWGGPSKGWSPLAEGVAGGPGAAVGAIVAVDHGQGDGTGRVLYAAGTFWTGDGPDGIKQWTPPDCPGPAIPGDLTGNGSVGVPDLLILLASWGPCDDCSDEGCPADLTGSCSIGVADLLILLANWG